MKQLMFKNYSSVLPWCSMVYFWWYRDNPSLTFMLDFIHCGVYE